MLTILDLPSRFPDSRNFSPEAHGSFPHRLLFHVTVETIALGDLFRSETLVLTLNFSVAFAIHYYFWKAYDADVDCSAVWRIWFFNLLALGSVSEFLQFLRLDCFFELFLRIETLLVEPNHPVFVGKLVLRRFMQVVDAVAFAPHVK